MQDVLLILLEQFLSFSLEFLHNHFVLVNLILLFSEEVVIVDAEVFLEGLPLVIGKLVHDFREQVDCVGILLEEAESRLELGALHDVLLDHRQLLVLRLERSERVS